MRVVVQFMFGIGSVGTSSDVQLSSAARATPRMSPATQDGVVLLGIGKAVSTSKARWGSAHLQAATRAVRLGDDLAACTAFWWPQTRVWGGAQGPFCSEVRQREDAMQTADAMPERADVMRRRPVV